MKKSAVSTLAVSGIIAVAGIVAVLAHFALKMSDAAQGMFEYGSLLAAGCTAVVLALAYGFVRFDRVHGIVLAAVTLHDLLVTFAVTALASIVMPGLSSVPAVYSLPYALVLAALFTLAQSLIVLQRARKIARTTSRREVSYEEAAAMATKETRCLRLEVTAAALVIMLGIAGFGGFKNTLAVVCPMVVAALVSLYSACRLTAALWMVFSEKIKSSKVYR